MITCPICGKRVCRTQSHVAYCSICKRLVCRDCLKICADCGRLACAEHTIACPACHAGICRKCMDACAVCDKAFHAKHLHKCGVCGRKLCPSCGRACARCKATTCPEHLVPLSRGREFCVPCFRKREKMIARIALPAIMGGIILLALLVYWMVR